MHPHRLELDFIAYVAQVEVGQILPDIERRKGRGTLSDAISLEKDRRYSQRTPLEHPA